MLTLLKNWAKTQSLHVSGQRKADGNVYWFAQINGEKIFVWAEDQTKDQLIENLNRITYAYLV